MNSSSNRYSPFGKSTRSGAEPEVPATGTSDEAKSDFARTGLSINSLRDPSLTPAEFCARFLRIGKALVEEDEQKSKARQADSIKGPKKPTPSAAPPPRPFKRKGSSDSAEQSSKRRHLVTLSSSGAAGEPAAAGSPSASEENVSTSALRVQDEPTLSPPKLSSWTDICNPKKPLECMIQVNNGPTKGTFKENPQNWAFQLTFDAGVRRSPVMTMEFFDHGIRRPRGGKTSWSLRDNVEDDWMVRDLKVHRVADCAADGDLRNRHVLAACRNDQERARLVCISMESWPKILGKCKKSFRQQRFSPIFFSRIPYHIRIWFIAPKDVESFEKQCLSVFVRCFEGRRAAYQDLSDANGVSLEDHLKAHQDVDSTQS